MTEFHRLLGICSVHSSVCTQCYVRNTPTVESRWTYTISAHFETEIIQRTMCSMKCRA